MKTLRDFNLKERRILVRFDFNVPLSQKGIILDDLRIKKAIPTIEYLIKERAKIILLSHLGRPEPWLSQRNQKFQIPNLKPKEYSLKPVALRLAKLLKRKVKFLDDCLGEEIQKEIERMKPGEILLLENLRFYKEEEENGEKFAKELAKLADIYIQDAFGACHRPHASIVGIPKYLTSGVGFLLERELKVLKNLMESPKKPLLAIIGGAKVETKTQLINKISRIADFVLIGGLIAREIKKKGISLEYPQKIIAPLDEIEGKDIGPETLKLFKEKISQAKTIFWNGPFGLIENKNFQKGSAEIAKAIIKSKAFSVVGGGETVEFINKLGIAERFNYVSTGGGAMVAFLGGEKLPGIEALCSGT